MMTWVERISWKWESLMWRLEDVALNTLSIWRKLDLRTKITRVNFIQEDGTWWLSISIWQLLDQHTTMWKLGKCWFCPYVMHRVNKNAIYHLNEPDGTILRMPIAKRRVKTFNKEHEEYLWTILLEVDEVHSSTEEEENLTSALSISNISTY